ncbi:hypothetical protein GGS26DRAFT_544993 [Hypomontagnella submonticulosa]|nr:hypothetical protein GGS26DRAFT_544993 [Hypomontagnella submonticulosa]
MAIPSEALQVVAVSLTALTLSIIATGLRIWSRRLQKVPLAFNDYMVFVGLVLTIGSLSSTISACFVGGLGVHLKDVIATNPDTFSTFLKLFPAGQILWASANTCVKFSILSLYTKIFFNKTFSYICYGTMAVSVAYWISVFLELFVLCTPVKYNWDKTIAGGKCEGENIAYLVAGTTNLLIDVFIVALPMPMLFGLRITLLKKFGVAAMFGLGAVICVISLLRVLWLQSWDLNDLTYTAGPGALYSNLEPTLGVVNACLPTIKPAINRIFGAGAMKWTKKKSNGTDSSNTVAENESNLLSSVKGARHGDFIRLEDNIPLTSVSAERHFGRNIEESNSITITRGWGVHNSPEGERGTC